MVEDVVKENPVKQQGKFRSERRRECHRIVMEQQEMICPTTGKYTTEKNKLFSSFYRKIVLELSSGRIDRDMTNP
jgi:hypothetical protein